jgi:NAD(P)H-dependent nitrite reductase small subunit
MPEFHRVCKTADLVEGKGKRVEIEGREIAIFRHQGDLFAIDDGCLHQGGSLAEGHLEGEEVVCPLHQWKYNIRTGVSAVAPRTHVETYPVRVEGDDVLLGIEPEASVRYVEVARVGDIREGKGRLVRVDARQIALFHVLGEYYAVKNLCPHEGAELWRGPVKGMELICPDHGWRFDLSTGKCMRHGDRDLTTYPVKVEGDRILVGV